MEEIKLDPIGNKEENEKRDKNKESIEVLKPVPTEEKVVIEVVCDKVEGRKFWMSANIKKGDEVLVTGKSFYIKVLI